MSLSAVAGRERVKGMRFWQSPDRTRVVLDMSGPVKPQVFTLRAPDRVVIDLPNTDFGLKLDTVKVSSNLVARVRKSRDEKTGALRIVLDLKHAAIPKVFQLKPYLQYGQRLVIDLADTTRVVKKNTISPRKPGDVLVAVDAGHGGEDPGASGYRGHKEKFITLALAKKVVAQLNKWPGISAFLTRKGDYYVGLRKRTKIARAQRAHLFVSIHADAFKDKRVHGSSVWTLSTRGSNSELGSWLESRENVDLLGVADDLDLGSFEPDVAKVLVSLSLEYALGSSIDAATDVLHDMAKVGKLHSRKPRQAAFVVLKSPGIPSLLIETGFISNPTDEKNLTSRRYQDKLARAVAAGLHQYLQEHPPEGTKFALRVPSSHRVVAGDTLSNIAKRYGISLVALKRANHLSSSRLRAGTTLHIPR